MMLYVGRGDVTMGRTTTDGEGNVVKQLPAQYEEKDDGACVVIGEVNTETGELGPVTSIYGDWQAAEYLGDVLSRIGKTRPINIPDFKAMVQKAEKDRSWGTDNIFCEKCRETGNMSCRFCIVNEWKEEVSDG